MNNNIESIHALTGRLMRIINKHSRIEETPIKTGRNTGLTAKEVHCLNAIGQQEGVNIKGIGDVLGVTKSAASQMVGRLEKKRVRQKGKGTGQRQGDPRLSDGIRLGSVRCAQGISRTPPEDPRRKTQGIP